MDVTTYLTHLETDVSKLSDAARKGLDPPVPSCPDWTVADLVGHIGGVQHWVTEIVSQRAQEYVNAFPEPPPPEELVDWYTAVSGRLLDTLRSTPPDTPVWTFAGDEHIAGWWYRRQALETVVHRWDAQGAHGRPDPVDPELAAEGIDELLMLFVATMVESGRAEAPRGSLHVHLTDRDGEWFGASTDGGVEISREHAKGDVAVRGPASDVFLFAWGRTDGASLDIIGDRSVLESWRIKI